MTVARRDKRKQADKKSRQAKCRKPDGIKGGEVYRERADMRGERPVTHMEQQPAARRQCAQATERAAKATKQRAERLMPGAQQCERKPRAKGRQSALI